MLTDRLGREINYLRVSLTDRCNFRCTYCMPENMQFEPRNEQLASEELLLICRAFVELGVEKIRLTGGEPTIHPDFDDLLMGLSAIDGLQNIALTTNGSRLAQKADLIAQSKIKQVNISLDSVDPENFKRITRTGDLSQVVAGIDEAKRIGVERLRLNAVVSQGVNDQELVDLLMFAIDKACHIAYIEEMPLGDMSDYSRREHFLSNQDVKQILQRHVELLPMTQKRRQAGPAHYYQVQGSATEVGFISPHSQNFCSQCNRVRLTRKGELILCLGQEDAVDLRAIVRQCDNELSAINALKDAILAAMQIKPDSHEFDMDDGVQVVRFMNVTGG